MRHLVSGGRRAAAIVTFAAVAAAGVTLPATTSFATPHASSSVRVSASASLKPHVSRSPKSVTIASGKKATFTVKASGSRLTYRWYASANGKKWSKISKATKSSYSATAKSSLNGHRYRVVIKNAHGSVTSHSATLTVAVKPRITSQPRPATVVSGKKVSFTVHATGNALSYQWYAGAPGKPYVRIKGATKSSYALTTSASKNGYSYKVAVENKAARVVSSRAKLTVVTKPKITTQPAEDLEVASGKPAKLSVKASGIGLKYQWQYADDSLEGDGDYHNISGATRSSYTFTAKTTSHDDLRVVVSNAAGKAESDDTFLVVDSSMTDPYGPDNGGLLTSWAVGLDTDLRGGATVVTPVGPTTTTVTSTFLGFPADLHAQIDQLSFALVVAGTPYPASVVVTALPAGMGASDFAATVTVPVSARDAAHGIWTVTDSSGSKPVTQYYSQD
jgi:hypothetical protein